MGYQYTTEEERREDRRKTAGAILRAVVWCWIVCGLGVLFVGGVYAIVNAFAPVINDAAEAPATTAENAPETVPAVQDSADFHADAASELTNAAQNKPAYATTPAEKRSTGQSLFGFNDFSDYAQMLLYLDAVRQKVKHTVANSDLEVSQNQANKEGRILQATEEDFNQVSAALENIKNQAIKALDAIQQKYTLQAFQKSITAANDMCSAVDNILAAFAAQTTGDAFYMCGNELYTAEDDAEPELQLENFEPRDWWYFDGVEGDRLYLKIPKVSPTYDTFFGTFDDVKNDV